MFSFVFEIVDLTGVGEYPSSERRFFFLSIRTPRHPDRVRKIGRPSRLDYWRARVRRHVGRWPDKVTDGTFNRRRRPRVTITPVADGPALSLDGGGGGRDV